MKAPAALMGAGRALGRANLLVIGGLLALGAALRGLRFAGSLDWYWAHWDDAKWAVPAMDILSGALVPHLVGNEYAGGLPTYLLAPWFWLVGASPITLDLASYGVGLAILATGYLVARRFLNPVESRLALAWLAVPPLYLAQWSVLGVTNHTLVLVFGNVFLVGTHQVFFGRSRRPAALLALGLLAGLGWWTSPGMAMYMAPFAALALRTGLVMRPRIGLFAAGFLVGGLPQWVYEVRYFPSARFALLRAGTEAPSSLGDRVRDIGSFTVRLLGVDLDRLPTAVAVVGLVAVVLPVGVALGYGAWRARGEIAWLLGPGRGSSGGRSILWMVAASNAVLLLGSSRPMSPWYLLALYSALPCWIGEWLAWLGRRRRLLAAGVLGAMLVFHLGLSWADTVGRVRPDARRWTPLVRGVTPLVDWLEARGHRRVYWAGFRGLPPYELSLLSGGRVMAVDLWREAVVGHGDLVDAEVAPAFVVREAAPEAAALREDLRALRMIVHERTIGNAHVLEPAPGFAEGFESIPPEAWVVTTSENQALAGNLADRDASTRWSTQGAQAPGQWIAVDLGREEEVSRVDLLSLDWQEVPAGYRVEVSRDRVSWQEVAAVTGYWGPFFFSEQHAVLKVRRGRVQAIFPPVRIRALRVVQTGQGGQRAWMARELFVYRSGPPRPGAPVPGALAPALAREGVQFVYANHWLSARVRVESRGMIGALPANYNLNAYGGQTRPEPDVIGRSRLTSGVGILVGSDTSIEGVRESLRGQGVPWRETTAGPYPLLVVTGPAGRPRALAREGWMITARDAAGSTQHAIDGRGRFRWSARGPAGPDTSLTLDLAERRRVSGIQLAPGTEGRTATDFGLEGSADGQVWARLGPLRWAGRLYWDGAEFLREGTHAWRVTFAPVEVRYLRIRPERTRPTGWSVGTIDCFG